MTESSHKHEGGIDTDCRRDNGHTVVSESGQTLCGSYITTQSGKELCRAEGRAEILSGQCGNRTSDSGSWAVLFPVLGAGPLCPRLCADSLNSRAMGI